MRSLRLSLRGRRVAWLHATGRVWIRVWPPPFDLRGYHLRFLRDFGFPDHSTLLRQIGHWAFASRLTLSSEPSWEKVPPIIRLASTSSWPGGVDLLFPESQGARIARFMLKPLKAGAYVSVRDTFANYLPLPDFEIQLEGHLLVESREEGTPLPELILAESKKTAWSCLCALAALSMATVRSSAMSPHLDTDHLGEFGVPKASFRHRDMTDDRTGELFAWQWRNPVPCHGDLSVYNIMRKSPMTYVIIDNADIHDGPSLFDMSILLFSAPSDLRHELLVHLLSRIDQHPVLQALGIQGDLRARIRRLRLLSETCAMIYKQRWEASPGRLETADSFVLSSEDIDHLLLGNTPSK